MAKNRHNNNGPGGGQGPGPNQQQHQKKKAAEEAALGFPEPPGSPNPVAAPPLNPVPDAREQNPFAVYSNALTGAGMNTGTMGDAFTNWVNTDAWADVQSQYKNYFTENPQVGGVGTTLQGFLGGYQQPGGAANNPFATNTAPGGNALLASLRQRYAAMSPHQRGINSAFGQKPGRWAVY
jgi:hypothetical protein